MGHDYENRYHPCVDYAFKKVFGSGKLNTSVLMDLLDAVLKPPPERRIVALQVLNPFNEKDSLDDKLSILDIKAQDEARAALQRRDAV